MPARVDNRLNVATELLWRQLIERSRGCTAYVQPPALTSAPPATWNGNTFDELMKALTEHPLADELLATLERRGIDVANTRQLLRDMANDAAVNAS